MNTIILILLVAVPLVLGALTIRVNEQIRDLKKHDTPESISVLTFDLSNKKHNHNNSVHTG